MPKKQIFAYEYIPANDQNMAQLDKIINQL